MCFGASLHFRKGVSRRLDRLQQGEKLNSSDLGVQTSFFEVKAAGLSRVLNLILEPRSLVHRRYSPITHYLSHGSVSEQVLVLHGVAATTPLRLVETCGMRQVSDGQLVDATSLGLVSSLQDAFAFSELKFTQSLLIHDTALIGQSYSHQKVKR